MRALLPRRAWGGVSLLQGWVTLAGLTAIFKHLFMLVQQRSVSLPGYYVNYVQLCVETIPLKGRAGGAFCPIQNPKAYEVLREKQWLDLAQELWCNGVPLMG